MHITFNKTEKKGFCCKMCTTYLGKREMHERQIVHSVLPNANDHNPSTATYRKCGRADTRLDAGALDYAGRGRVLIPNVALALAASRPEPLADGLSIAPGIEKGVDLVGHTGGDERLGEVEARLLDVGDDEGVGTGGASGQQGTEADGACAADDDAATERQVGDAEGGQDDAQGFHQGALGEV